MMQSKDKITRTNAMDIIMRFAKELLRVPRTHESLKSTINAAGQHPTASI